MNTEVKTKYYESFRTQYVECHLRAIGPRWRDVDAFEPVYFFYSHDAPIDLATADLYQDLALHRIAQCEQEEVERAMRRGIDSGVIRSRAGGEPSRAFG